MSTRHPRIGGKPAHRAPKPKRKGQRSPGAFEAELKRAARTYPVDTDILVKEARRELASKRRRRIDPV